MIFVVIYVLIALFSAGLWYYFCFDPEIEDELEGAAYSIILGFFWPVELVLAILYYLLKMFVKLIAFCDGFIKGIKGKC